MPRKQPSAKRTGELADFKNWMRKNALVVPRQDVVELVATAKVMLDIVFPPSDYPLLGDLLDLWSAKGILTAASILLDAKGERDFFEYFWQHVAKACEFLLYLPIPEWRSSDIVERWLRFNLELPVEQDFERYWPENPLHKLAREQYENLGTENTKFIN